MLIPPLWASPARHSAGHLLPACLQNLRAWKGPSQGAQQGPCSPLAGRPSTGDPGHEAAWAGGLPWKQAQPDAQARAALRDAASGSDEFLREWHVKTGGQKSVAGEGVAQFITILVKALAVSTGWEDLKKNNCLVLIFRIKKWQSHKYLVDSAEMETGGRALLTLVCAECARPSRQPCGQPCGLQSPSEGGQQGGCRGGRASGRGSVPLGRRSRRGPMGLPHV